MRRLSDAQRKVLDRLAARWVEVMLPSTREDAKERAWVVDAGNLRTLDALRKRGLIENKVGTREARITMRGLEVYRP